MPTTIYNLGSINRDKTIRVSRFPNPGETLAGQEVNECLGGKGLNISLALHRANQTVRHIGAVHSDDFDTCNGVAALGLETQSIEASSHKTGQAVILLDDTRENAIILCTGANKKISEAHIDTSMADAKHDDWLVIQNETNNQLYATKLAKAKSMKIGLVAAPFDVELVRSLANRLDLLVVNEVEAKQLEEAFETVVSDMKIPLIAVTKGSQGATLYRNGKPSHVQGLSVEPVDTTAAGDTFFGFFLGALLSGYSDDDALKHANTAAALSVQKYGAAQSIPTLKEVEKCLQEQ